MNISDIAALSELIYPEQEEEYVSNPQKGSIFGPSDVGTKSKTELAKPFAQMEVKGGRKQPQQQEQSQEESIQEKVQGVSKTKQVDPKDIWTADEIQTIPKSNQETRIRPEVDVLFKQSVATEDVYGGWSQMDQSSNTCQFLLVRIQLPGTKLTEISLEVQQQVIVAQSTKYYLNYQLPYQVKDKEGKAKWISDKETLEITLPIIRQDPF